MSLVPPPADPAPGGCRGQRPVHILGAGLSGLAAAIVLAHTGREVHVHELRGDSGARFDGDFQGIENWSRPGDFMDEIGAWGYSPSSFRSAPFRSIDLVSPDGRIHRVHGPETAFWLVQRGTGPHTIDQGFKRQALEAGAHLHYRTRRAEADCDIVATGPRRATGVVRGELFETTAPDRVTLQLDDRLAPGAYTYMIVWGGVGLVATVLLRRQRDPDRFLDETLAWYQAHYPDLDRRPLRRIGGSGCFALPRRSTAAGRHYVGEAGGLQDCLWGFGMRHAITSGYLAAQALLGGPAYQAELDRRLRPYQEASLANRWLLARLGDRGQSLLARLWMYDQRRRGEGLSFVSRLYRPSWLHRAALPLARRMLAAAAAGDPLGTRYMPLAPAAPRDRWTPSPAAAAIAEASARRGSPPAPRPPAPAG